MSSITKFAWSGVAVVAALVMSLGLMVQTTSAATVTDRADGTVTTNAAGTAVTMELTLTAAEMQNTETLILTLPNGFAFVSANVAIGAAPATTLALNAAGVLSTTNTANDTATFTATANNNAAAVLTFTLTIRYAGGTSGGVGNIALTGSGVAGNTNVGTLSTQYASGGTITVTAPVVSLAADGSEQTSVTANFVDGNGVAVGSRPISWSVSLGVLGTGSGKTATSFTNASGNTSQNYRGGGGQEATDTIIASNQNLNAVGTLAMPLTTGTGTTANNIVFLAPTNLAVGANVTNTSPNYQSPTNATNVAVQVRDSANLGVNNQTVLISTDKGTLAQGFNAACSNAKALSASTASLAQSVGGQVRAGIIQLTYCADQTDAAGTATLTAQNISTSMTNATTSISMAGRPAEVNVSVAGSSIAVSVTDAGGNPVADGTPVRFTISQNAGAVSTACTTTTNGSASATVALIATSGTVIVSSDWNETGAAATCAAAGAQQVATSAVVGGAGTVTPPPTTGAGTFAATPVFSAGTPGLAQVVFNGGSLAQLEAALIANGATGAWAQTSTGAFVLHIVGAPAFANAPFAAAFPAGFSGVTALTLTK